jgi:hypothetical protein
LANPANGARANAATVLKPLETTAQLGKADGQRSIVVIKNVGQRNASKIQYGSRSFASVAE